MQTDTDRCERACGKRPTLAEAACETLKELAGLFRVLAAKARRVRLSEQKDSDHPGQPVRDHDGGRGRVSVLKSCDCRSYESGKVECSDASLVEYAAVRWRRSAHEPHDEATGSV